MQKLKKMFGGRSKKEHVDPYVVVSYAGRDVQSKILYSITNPPFRECLTIGFLFPSMCDKIKFTIMDW